MVRVIIIGSMDLAVEVDVMVDLKEFVVPYSYIGYRP